MVKKEILVKQFENYHDFEEALINRLSNFINALNSTLITPQDNKLFNETLEKLKNDSVKHRQMIEEMLQYIKTSQKNEF